MNIESTTVNKLIDNVSRGAGTLFDEIVSPVILNKRIQSNEKYTYVRKNGEVIYFEEGKPVIINDLTGSEQVELQKYKNQVSNILELYDVLNERLQNSKEELDSFKKKIEDSVSLNDEFFQYYTEKTQFISNENKSKILNEIIVNKLHNNEEISTNILDFISNLTTSDIKKLQAIKSLLLTLYYIDVNEDNLIILNEEKNYKHKLLNFLPSLTGDGFLSQLDNTVRWDDILDFSMRGLFTVNENIITLPTKSRDIKRKYIITSTVENEDFFILSSPKGQEDIKLSNYTLSALGKEVLSVVPSEKSYINDYISLLQSENLFSELILTKIKKTDNESEQINELYKKFQSE